MSQAGITIPPYINGRFLEIQKPERIFQAANPACPADILGITGWSKELAPMIVGCMQPAQKKFQELKFAGRLEVVQRLIHCLRENAEEIKSQMVLELGRTQTAVEEEWKLCEEVFQILPKFCHDLLSEKTENDGWTWEYAPVGSILISANISLPVYSLLSTSLPALIAGNAVTLRPSPHCPLSASGIANCIHQTGFPPGLVNVIYGDLEVYRRLILTHQFDTVLYTGGEESLEQIRRDLSTHQNTRLVLCGGGKNAALVLPSCDLKNAVSKILYGACIDAGQRLESTGLVFVHASLADEFSEKFVQAVKTMPIGSRDDQTPANSPFMGPLCSATSRERFLRFQGIAARESEETLRWGKSIDKPGNGFFVSPGVHLLKADNVTKSVYASNAFFGPDVAIIPVQDAFEAVAILDSLNGARCLAVHTNFEEEVRVIREKSNVPTLIWNCPTTDLNPRLPSIGRGRAGNSYISGLRFLLSTVFPKTMNFKESVARQGSLFCALLAFTGAIVGSLMQPRVAIADYQKAVEGSEVVKGKIYPRGGKIQINPLQGGVLLNQSFIDTYTYNGGLTYHFNEWHALNLDVVKGFSKDRDERKCIESFYFNTKAAAANGAESVCDPENATNPNTPATTTPPEDAVASVKMPFTRKPAYMAIRQLDQMVTLNYQWTPVYGKQLFFLSTVGYLDVYTSIGLGMAMTTYWPLQEVTASGKSIREEGTTILEETGESGRPLAEKQTSPVFSMGIGNRYFFAKNFLVNFEIKNVTIFGNGEKGKGSDIMNFFGLAGGLGFIF